VIYRVEGVNGLKNLTAINQKCLSEADLIALLQCHDSLLPIWGFPSSRCSLTARLSVNFHGIDPQDLYVKELLDGLPDLHFVRSAVRHNRVLIELLALSRAFLGDTHGLNYFKRIHLMVTSLG
jgi:hypothetical protein